MSDVLRNSQLNGKCWSRIFQEIYVSYVTLSVPTFNISNLHESFDHWKLNRTFLELPEVVILSVSVSRNPEPIYSINFQDTREFNLRFVVNQYLQKRTIDRGNFDHSRFCAIEHQTENVLLKFF